MDVRWRWGQLDALTSREVHALLALRQRVFVVEQRCAYLDADELDLVSTHLLGLRGEALIACLRITPPGSRFPEHGIGRVVSAPEVRREGYGRAACAEALRYVGSVRVRISAQRYLERFYASLGFARTAKEPYLEDDIPHVEMLRPALDGTQ